LVHGRYGWRGGRDPVIEWLYATFYPATPFEWMYLVYGPLYAVTCGGIGFLIARRLIR
jgi:hypothetical protein